MTYSPHFGRRQRLGGAATDYDTLPAAAGVSLSLNDLIIWAQAQMDPEAFMALSKDDHETLLGLKAWQYDIVCSHP